MKYLRTSTSFSSVPWEISLAIEVTNCPHKCSGCHSPELCEDIGTPLNVKSLFDIIEKYSFMGNPLFTCLTFMGGDQESDDLICMILAFKVRYPGIKVCLYTGSDKVDSSIYNCLDYLKTGKYVERLGPLGSPTTNQKFINIARV